MTLRVLVVSPAEMVDVELVPVTLRKPAIVEVAVVDAVVMKLVVSDSLMVEVAPLAILMPLRERRVPGVVLPTPVSPLESMSNGSVVPFTKILNPSASWFKILELPVGSIP